MSTTRQTLLLYWRSAWNYPAYVIGILIALPLTILAHQFLPALIAADILERLSTGDFTRGDLWGSFGNQILLYGGLIVGGMVIGWRLVILLLWRLEAKVVRNLALLTFNHLLHQSVHFHNNNFGGSLVSQSSKLCGGYIRIADTTFFQVIPLATSVILTVIILGPTVPLFAFSLVAFTIFYIFCAIYATRFIRHLNAAEAKAGSKQLGYLADAITNIMAVKAFAREKLEYKRYKQAVEHTRKRTNILTAASFKRDLYFSSTNSIITVASIAIAAASVVLWSIEIGIVFLVLSYTTNVTQYLWNFSGNVMRNYNRAMGDAHDMIEILNKTSEVKDPPHPEKVRISKGEIEFSNMAFKHSDASEEDMLFENFQLHIKAGERVGLVGHSGSGKTTLTKLLLRFADIDKGTITIDHQDITKITQADLRKHITYVPQEPLLFHRSLRENIAYGSPDASEAEIVEAAKKAHAIEFIEKLQDGYDTLVGERGVKLSGGQRQRIAIARAILKNAPILVLDEATSALDSESEKYIQDALGELIKGRTAIVIAHRLSTIQKMDRIIVLQDGHITEEGSHKQLLAKKGVYAELWTHQSGGFIEE